MIVKQKSIVVTALMMDIAFIVISFFLSAVLAQSFAILISHPYMFLLLGLLVFVWYYFSTTGTLYREIGSRLYFEQITQMLKVVTFQALTIVLFIFIVKELLFQRNFLVIYTLILTTLVFLRIIVSRKTFKHLNKGASKLLVIGNSKSAQMFVEEVRNIPSLGYATVELYSMEGENKQFEVTLAELKKYIEINAINEIVVSPLTLSEEQVQKIFKLANVLALHTFMLPDYPSLLSKNYSVSTVGNYPLIAVRSEPLENIHTQFFKRIVDLISAILFFAIIGIWLFPVIFIFQKILNPGPIFYIQKRVGKNNKIFKCYKLRSMLITETDKEFSTVRQNDSRITKFGMFLRITNLDEIPQMINVLLGDMSIVGPRPHSVTFDKKYEEFVEEIKLRSLIKPGITGWAQIHGLRGDIADPELNKIHISNRILYDIWYIENYSLSLDFKILLLTVWQIINFRNPGK